MPARKMADWRSVTRSWMLSRVRVSEVLRAKLRVVGPAVRPLRAMPLPKKPMVSVRSELWARPAWMRKTAS